MAHWPGIAPNLGANYTELGAYAATILGKLYPISLFVTLYVSFFPFAQSQALTV